MGPAGAHGKWASRGPGGHRAVRLAPAPDGSERRVPSWVPRRKALSACLSAYSLFAGFEAATELGGWRLALDTEMGLAALDARGGLIDRISPLTTTAMSVRADRRLTNRDKIMVSLSQPPRIENGSALLRVPVGRTLDRSIVVERVPASLEPSPRQIDLSARWRRAGLLGGALQMEATAFRNPGHAATRPAFSVLAGWRAEFWIAAILIAQIDAREQDSQCDPAQEPCATSSC